VEVAFEDCVAALGPVEHDRDTGTCWIEVLLPRGPLRRPLRMRLDIDRWWPASSHTALELMPRGRVRPTASYFRDCHRLLDSLSDEFRAGTRSYLQQAGSARSTTEEPMQTVISDDGTRIAYDSYGDGPALILIGGALSFRKFKKMEQFAETLSDRYTVINYDRRGRGDSGDTKPFALEREIEDIAALIDAVGGTASLWGWSSGGALALRAAGAGIGVEKVAAYEPPFSVDPQNKVPTRDYGERIEQLVARNDRAGLVKHFMRNGVGLPAPFVALMRLMPMYKDLKANALTLGYDFAAMGPHNMVGQPLDPAEWASVTVPALIAYGSKTPDQLKNGSKAIAALLAEAELVEIAGGTHNVSVDAFAPVLAEFLSRDRVAVAT
jgi:pimeloyl-ACP methyl ester carboxylesterase